MEWHKRKDSDEIGATFQAKPRLGFPCVEPRGKFISWI
jgi:hypothetical protein